MDYEKAYKDALERARKYNNVYKDHTMMFYAKGALEDIFPELAESEDEKIRKEIINYFRCQSREEPSRKGTHIKWITWLEKQDQNKFEEELEKAYKCADKVQYRKGYEDAKCEIEKQSKTNETIDRDKFAQNVLRGAAINLITWIDYNAAEGNMCLSNMECKDIEDALVNGNWDKIYAYIKKKLEKQGEQKPIDKIESKFKIGDWIVKNDGKDCFSDGSYVLQITNIDDISYKLSNGCYLTEPFIDTYRLWTIQYAKDGDVLKEDSCIFIVEKMNPNGTAIVHCCLFDDGEFDLTSSTLKFEVDSTKPATKEQRDFLFQKMKEAGYTFDFEKKELKKIEQKPAWSKEDEGELYLTISLLDKLKEEAYTIDCENCINWLKSLKPQPHWKPTKEQLNFLINLSDNPGLYLEERNSLEELCNNLKKL